MNSTTSGCRATSVAVNCGEPAWEVALLFPAQGEWTESEYLALDTNRMIELSNGCWSSCPCRLVFHQLIAHYLSYVLKAFVAAPRIRVRPVAPLPVRLWSGQVPRSRISSTLRGNDVPNLHGQPQGADLAMEVVSEGAENRKRDLETKRQEYAKARIAEYWIVDPQEQRITVLTLDGQSYRRPWRIRPGHAGNFRLVAWLYRCCRGCIRRGGGHQRRRQPGFSTSLIAARRTTGGTVLPRCAQSARGHPCVKGSNRLRHRRAAAVCGRSSSSPQDEVPCRFLSVCRSSRHCRLRPAAVAQGRRGTPDRLGGR